MSASRTLFECRCCDSSTWGWSDGSGRAEGWKWIANIDGPNAICPGCQDDPSALDGLKRDGYEDARVGE